MDEDFLDVTESSKKVGIFFVLIIILFIAAGYFFVFKKVHFSTKAVEVELGSSLPDKIEDYITTDVDLDEFDLDVSKVNLNEVGEYTYTIKHDKTVKKGIVKVVDTTPPEFTLKKVQIEEGVEDFYFGEFLDTCEDFSKPCLVTLKNTKDEEKIEKIGEYTVDIEVADIYGNKRAAKAELSVVKKGTLVDEKAKDLEYDSNSEGIENFSGTIYEKWDMALLEESDELSDRMASASSIDLDKYISTNYEGKKLNEVKIIKLYNKSKYVIGLSIQITLSDNTVVYVEKNKVPVENSEDIDE